jgi:hypothetical protein
MLGNATGVGPRTPANPFSTAGMGAGAPGGWIMVPAGNELVRQASSSTIVTGTVLANWSSSEDSGTSVLPACAGVDMSASIGTR